MGLYSFMIKYTRHFSFWFCPFLIASCTTWHSQTDRNACLHWLCVIVKTLINRFHTLFWGKKLYRVILNSFVQKERNFRSLRQVWLQSQLPPFRHLYSFLNPKLKPSSTLTVSRMMHHQQRKWNIFLCLRIFAWYFNLTWMILSFNLPT